jgi:deoxyadenosine/deoxycytidine kinase
MNLFSENRTASISVDGNIASGKTQLLQNLQKHVDYPVFFEQVEHWKFLSKFYQDPRHYSFIFQLEILFSYAQAHTCSLPYLMERSTSAGYHVFAKLLHHQGNMTDDEFRLFGEIWKEYNENPTLILYLDVLPEICYERVLQRCRAGEAPITLEYLKEVEGYYSNYLDEMAANGCCIIRISSPNPQQEALSWIRNHLTQHSNVCDPR